MKRLIITFVLLFVTLFASNISKAALPQYQIIDLGAGYAFGINNDGQVVGRVGEWYNGQATLFDTTGQGNNINLGSGAAYSINDSGQIVGGDAGNAINYKPNPDGTYTAEVICDGAGATSINNNGQIVGGNGNAVIFTYDENLHQYQITSLAKGVACDNNNNGQIAGTEAVGWYLNITYKAVLWNPNGSGGYTKKNLGTLSGYGRSETKSINNNGKVVGDAYNKPGMDPDLYGKDFRAVLFDETGGGQNIYLGSLSGYADSWAQGINDNGQIVGTSFNHTPSLGFATLFDPTGDGNNIDLNTTLINPLPGWTLREAMSINNDGWIIGYMYKAGVGFHAFLLVPVPKHSPVACIADVNQPIEGQGPFGAKVTLDGSCSSDADSTPGTNDDINDFNWYRLDPADSNNEILLGSGQILDCNLALGSHTILLEVIDKAGESDSNEITVTIEDTTPPQFNFSVSPNVLWPPNGKMVKITPTYDVNDICDESPEVSILDVTASEAGDANDIKITDDGSIYLCARRSGNSTGLIYTITCQACDASGNCTTKSDTVTVPHDCR